jgi:molecular chaperone GrpE (heat shock protein)
MNDPFAQDLPGNIAAGQGQEPATQGMSSLYKLFEAFIALREKNERQHRLFEQSLTRTRDNLQDNFNSFAAATQGAYQQLRRELTGEKRAALALLNELVDLSLDLEHIVASRPENTDPGGQGEATLRWAEAVEVQCRKVQAALRRHGVHPYDAVIGSPYNPALHERVGSKRMEGMDALRVAEQREHGFASQHPEFVLRRPKVIVSE